LRSEVEEVEELELELDRFKLELEEDGLFEEDRLRANASRLDDI